MTLFVGTDDPRQVTTVTGVMPVEAPRQGERYGARGGRARQGMWMFRSDDHVEGMQAAAHVAWLLDTLEPAADRLSALLAAHPDWTALLSIRSYQEVPRVGFTLPAESIARLAALRADLQVSVIMTALELAVDEEVSDVAFSLGQTTVSSSAAVDSDMMADHAAWLVEHATPLRAGSPNAAGHLTISWARVASNGAIVLPAAAVAGLAALDADVSCVIMTA